jgi:trimeric autotransporter adhesin
MKRNTQQNATAASTAWQRVAFVMLLLISVFAALNGNRAYAAPPPAGTNIGNQASASYSDALGNAQSPVTSNTVVTTVSQVASFTLTADQSKPGAPGTQVYFPHTLTNTGNGNDTFTLAVANRNDAPNNTFDFSSVAIYIDANGDGIPDNATPITSTGAVATGGVFKFVAVGVVPGGALNGQIDTLRVTAAGDATVAAAASPAYTAAAAAFNTDTVTVTGNAVISMTKSMSALSGADGSGPYSVTLTYTNTGNATASAVTLGDLIPAGMTYVAGTGRWSVTGATVLTDTSAADPHGTAPNTVIYDFGVTTAGRVTAVINQVLPGGNGTITFNVNIAAGTAPSVINNTATFAYNDSTVNAGPFNTNTVGFTVNQRAVVVLDDVGSVSNGIAGSLVADSDATADVVGVATVPQGSTVQFDNVVHNNGNGPDSFDMTLSGSSFPAGTSFQLYKADGVTPLVDTNGNATPDTGVVAAGGVYHVIVKALLPIGASGNNGGAGFVVTKTATSKFDPTKTDTVTDKLAAISASSVDLTNNTWRSDVAPPAPLPGPGTATAGNAATTGFGPGTATAVTTQSTNPGTATTFRLFLNNTSTVDDNYDLSVTSSLPSGWTVAFKADGGAGNCSTTGSTITNSGIINAANSRLVCAVVTVPATGAGAAAGTTNITFRAQSAASGAFDTKVDAVTVNTIHNVVLTPNNTGQAFPGNFVVYTHTIANNGNVTETISFPAGTFLVDSAATWSSVLYRDNGTTPGALDAGDTSVSSSTSFTLAPGASATLFVKVTAPLTATAGQTDTTTVTAAFNAGASTTSATDITTVISGVLNLVKDQALDAACDGTPDTAYSNGTITARPGQCVRYRITATNSGTANVTSVVLSDQTPANTVYNTGGTCFPAGAPGTFGAATTVGTVGTTPAGAAANCAASVTVSATVGTLTPSQNAVLTFGVQVNQ